MKVLSTECYGSGYDLFELEVLEHLQENEPNNPGHPHFSELVDSFTIQTKIGTTVCLIFGVMADKLHGFQKTQSLSPTIMKKFVKQILLALDYAHKSGVIHTGIFRRSCNSVSSNLRIDIKSDNIMIQLPDESIIKDRYMRSVIKSTTKAVGNTGPSFLYWPNDHFELIRREQGINYEVMLTIEPFEHIASGMRSHYLAGSSCEEEDSLKLNVFIYNILDHYGANFSLGFALRLGARKLDT